MGEFWSKSVSGFNNIILALLNTVALKVYLTCGDPQGGLEKCGIKITTIFEETYCSDLLYINHWLLLNKIIPLNEKKSRAHSLN